MLTVHLRRGLLGDGPRETYRLDYLPGMTAGRLLDCVRDLLPDAGHLGVGFAGRQLRDDEDVPDGATLVVASPEGWATLGPIIWEALITAVVGLGIGYLVGALMPKPKAPGVAQQRGDDSSATNAWNGITTSYGQGLLVPVVLGRHATGGQVISFYRADVNRLGVVLALSEGPVRRIGDAEAGEFEFSPNGARQAPGEVRVGAAALDQESAVGSMAPGTLDQRPMQLVGVVQTTDVQALFDSTDDEYQFDYIDTDAVSGVRLLINMPSGFYRSTPTGLADAVVVFSIEWRRAGETTWNAFQFVSVANGWWGGSFGSSGLPNEITVRGDQFAKTCPVECWFATYSTFQQVGPLTVRVKRIRAGYYPPPPISFPNWYYPFVQLPDAQLNGAPLLESIGFSKPYALAYPGVALLALVVSQSTAIGTQNPTFVTRVDGFLVRVWNETDGFSEPLWDAPTSGPWATYSHPPGRNNAWIAAEFATNKRWGLGAVFSDDKIDWPAFHRWAIYCDQDPNPGDPWGEAQFCYDAVWDSPKPAWERLLEICSAGHAAPIYKNGKLSVVYQYRDSHSDGVVTVPAKTAVQLIDGALCEDVQVRWLPKGQRPTAFQFQFLNEDQLWSQDVLLVEDDEGALNDPTDPRLEDWVPEPVQAYGITRESQLLRHGKFLHRINRKIRRELTFTCGPWLLAAEVGDLFDFQHDVLRPFGSDRPTVMQVMVDVTAGTTIDVDHVVTLPAAFVVRMPDASPQVRTVTAVAPITGGTRLSFASALTVAAGATIVVGLAGKLTETYEVVGITLERDMRRKVRALQWAPECYDVISPDSIGADVDDVADIVSQADVTAAPSAVLSVRVRSLGRGKALVLWSLPDDRSAQTVRVFVGATSDSMALVAESANGSAVLDGHLQPGQTYGIGVALQSTDGSWPAPTVALTYTAEEFPPVPVPAPSNAAVSTSPVANRVVLRWDACSSAEVVGYEVRVGSDWTAGVPVYRGALAECELDPPPAYSTWQIAAVAACGAYSARLTVAVDVTPCIPYAGALSIDSVEYVPAGAGVATLSNAAKDTTTEPAAPFFALTGEALSGTVTSAEVSPGYEAPFFLRVAWSAQELDGTTVDEWTFEVGGGEAQWRTVDARPASPGNPGIDWRTSVDELSGIIDDLPATQLVDGSLGEAGTWTSCIVESRTYTAGAWSDWTPHIDKLVVCSKWQARATLGRASPRHAVRLRHLTLQTII